MIVTLAERRAESAYVEVISQGQTTSDGATIRPAESRWHMVVVRHQGKTQLFHVGPLPTAGMARWEAGAEILWIRFRLGVFMPHLPLKDVLDTETVLPGAASQSFWLKGAAWQFPSYENVETFVEQLVRDEILVCDPLVETVLQDQPHHLALRTVRHRFLQATGLTQNQIRQIERAQTAALLLKQGVSILDTVYELNYFDQPHLTRSLKQWVGYTPAQIVHAQDSHALIQESLFWPEVNAERFT